MVKEIDHGESGVEVAKIVFRVDEGVEGVVLGVLLLQIFTA